MAATASPIPAVFQAGETPDMIWQPLYECGYGNPMFYHYDGDDFSPYRAGDYTATATGTGATIAATPGDGGLVLFTVGTTAGVVALQRTTADFTINTQPKKVFFECRLKMSAWATAGVTGTFGLIQSTATPGTVTDGVYFALSATGTLSINAAIASAITTVQLPTGSYTLAANGSIDLGFFMNRNGDILAYADAALVGYIPQSLIGTTGNVQNAGAIARIPAQSTTTANLCPTIGFTQTGTTSVTATVDFFQVLKER